ncbi:hypothetical protein GCM10007978_34980 [Shewanella hanedai]|nr:hypothetical protein GCM10007978_34980 [Shewanella hanedai]
MSVDLVWDYFAGRDIFEFSHNKLTSGSTGNAKYKAYFFFWPFSNGVNIVKMQSSREMNMGN